MAITPCPCSLRQEDWPFDCDIEDHNGIRCGSDPDGNQVIWAAPDDGVLFFEESPTVKSAYITGTGAQYDVDSVTVGSAFNLTNQVEIAWENTTCHSYWVLTEFRMGIAVPSLGAETTAYAGTDNSLVLTDTDGNDTTLVDTTRLVGAGYNTYLPDFCLATQYLPPLLTPAHTRVDPGETLTAQLQGIGQVDADGPGTAETFAVLNGWQLFMTCLPIGVG